MVHPSASAPIEAKPGSQTALRERNRQRIVDTLIANGPSTQAELSRRTGLSSATVSNIIRTMSAEGMASTSPTTSSGRRAVSVSLTGGDAVAVGIDFGRRHFRLILSTPGYVIVDEEFVELPRGYSALEGIDSAAQLLEQLLDRHGIPRSSVLGVGVGIPGPIDGTTGTVVQGAILPEWVGIDLQSLTDRLRFPVLFDNDANLGALAEITWGPHGSVRNLVFVKIASGIGAGLILDGRPHYGHLGITGEIGHMTVVEQGVVCHCGNRGCLETVSSISTMIELLGRQSHTPITAQDIVDGARRGDSATLRVLEDAGMMVGRSLASVANLVGPEVVVIGGPLVALGDILLRPVSRGLLRYAVPSVGRSVTLVMSSLGERAEGLGAVALILQRHSVSRY